MRPWPMACLSMPQSPRLGSQSTTQYQTPSSGAHQCSICDLPMESSSSSRTWKSDQRSPTSACQGSKVELDLRSPLK